MRSEFDVQAPFIETLQTACIHLSFPKRLIRFYYAEDTLLPICLGHHVRRFRHIRGFQAPCSVPKIPPSKSIWAYYKTALLSLRALRTTVNDDMAMAAPANIGDIKSPNVG